MLSPLPSHRWWELSQAHMRNCAVAYQYYPSTAAVWLPCRVLDCSFVDMHTLASPWQKCTCLHGLRATSLAPRLSVQNIMTQAPRTANDHSCSITASAVFETCSPRRIVAAMASNNGAAGTSSAAASPTVDVPLAELEQLCLNALKAIGYPDDEIRVITEVGHSHTRAISLVLFNRTPAPGLAVSATIKQHCAPACMPWHGCSKHIAQ